MNCIARPSGPVTGWRPAAAGSCVSIDRRTRDRQAAVTYLRSARAAGDDIERDTLRRLAAQLVLPRPE